MVSATGWVGSQCLLLEWVVILAAIHWGGNGVCPKKQLLGGTGLSEAMRGSEQAYEAGHVPSAEDMWWATFPFLLQTGCECIIH